jgi:hypothetical protein
VTVSVAPCRSPADPLLPDPPPACLPRRLPAHVRPPRSLIKDEHALQRKGRSQTLSLSDSLSGDHGIYTSACISAAPSIIVLRALRVYKSGSPPEGLFPPGPAHSQPSSYTGVSGVRNGVRISLRHGVPTGAQGWIYLTTRHASAVTTCGPARRQSSRCNGRGASPAWLSEPGDRQPMISRLVPS